MSQVLSAKSLPKDNIRYFLIICTIFLILLNLFRLSQLKDSEFYRIMEDPWNPGDAGIELLFVALAAMVLIFLSLVSGLLATFYTIFNFLRQHELQFRKKRDYYITLGIGCVLLTLMITITIGTQIRTTTIQNSYTQLIQQGNSDLTPNINIPVNNFTVQPLGSYTFQYDLTYMYLIVTENQPLPTKDFELVFSFTNSTAPEPLEAVMDFYKEISPKNIRNSIELVLDSTNYYYIITAHRLFFDQRFSPDSMINYNLTCHVNQSDPAPDLLEFQIKLMLLEDPSDTIIKGVRELTIIDDDPDYAFRLALPSILVILNSLVFILKEPLYQIK